MKTEEHSDDENTNFIEYWIRPTGDAANGTYTATIFDHIWSDSYITLDKVYLDMHVGSSEKYKLIENTELTMKDLLMERTIAIFNVSDSPTLIDLFVAIAFYDNDSNGKITEGDFLTIQLNDMEGNSVGLKNSVFLYLLADVFQKGSMEIIGEVILEGTQGPSNPNIGTHVGDIDE